MVTFFVMLKNRNFIKMSRKSDFNKLYQNISYLSCLYQLASLNVCCCYVMSWSCVIAAFFFLLFFSLFSFKKCSDYVSTRLEEVNTTRLGQQIMDISNMGVVPSLHCAPHTLYIKSFWWHYLEDSYKRKTFLNLVQQSL